MFHNTWFSSDEPSSADEGYRARVLTIILTISLFSTALFMPVVGFTQPDPVIPRLILLAVLCVVWVGLLFLNDRGHHLGVARALIIIMLISIGITGIWTDGGEVSIIPGHLLAVFLAITLLPEREGLLATGIFILSQSVLLSLRGQTSGNLLNSANLSYTQILYACFLAVGAIMFWLISRHLRTTLKSLYITQSDLESHNKLLIEEIAQRKQAQAAQQQLVDILDSTPDLVGITNPNTFYFDYLNRAGRQILGYALDEDLSHVRADNFFDASASSGDTLRILREVALPTAAKAGIWSGDVSVHTRFGQTFPVSQVIISHRNDAGEITAFSTIARDISATQAATVALKESEERLRMVIESAPFAIIGADPAGRIVMSNETAAQLFGYPRLDLHSLTIEDLIPESARHAHIQKRDEFSDNPSQRRMGTNRHLSAQRQDGTIFPAEIALSYLETNRERTAIAFVTDITDRLCADKARQEAVFLQRKLAHEQELREIKSRFFSMVAHDFRTPLSVIAIGAGMLRHLGKESDSPRHLTQYERIESQVHHLTHLVDQISTLNREEMVPYKLVPTSLDLNDFLQQIIDDLIQTYDDLVTFALDTDHIHEPVILDGALVRRIFVNLLSNAAKYSPNNGQVQVSPRVEAGEVVVTVADNGIGIPKEDQARIFQIFHRAANVGSINGTGLGLMIVQQAVGLHRGRLDFTSQENVGSSFTVALPLLTEPEDPFLIWPK